MWWFLSSCEGDAFGANDEACKVFYVSKFYAKNKFEKKWMDVRTKFLKEFLNRHNAPTRHEIEQRRNLTSTSGTFCSKTINELRKMVSKLILLMLLAKCSFQFQRFRCSTKLSNVGPTITVLIKSKYNKYFTKIIRFLLGCLSWELDGQCLFPWDYL